MFFIPNLLVQPTLDEFGCDPRFIGKYRNKIFISRVYTYGFEFQSAKGYVFLGKNIEREKWEGFIYDLEDSEWRKGYLDPEHIFTWIEIGCECY